MLMNDSEKLNVKWKYLLKPVRVKIFVKPSENPDYLPSISVLDMEPVSLSEFTIKMPVF